MGIVRFFCKMEDSIPAWNEDSSSPQSLIVTGIVLLVECLQKQDASNMKVWMLLRECLQLGNCIFVESVRSSDIIYDMSLHKCCSLPIGHCSVEDLVDNIFHHLCDEIFLNCIELLRSVVVGGCRELSLEVVGMFLVVDETDIDRHL